MEIHTCINAFVYGGMLRNVVSKRKLSAIHNNSKSTINRFKNLTSCKMPVFQQIKQKDFIGKYSAEKS